MYLCPLLRRSNSFLVPLRRASILPFYSPGLFIIMILHLTSHDLKSAKTFFFLNGPSKI